MKYERTVKTTRVIGGVEVTDGNGNQIPADLTQTETERQEWELPTNPRFGEVEPFIPVLAEDEEGASPAILITDKGVKNMVNRVLRNRGVEDVS